MFKSLKRAVATLATLALMVTNTGLAFAQTFNDVPTDAWYFDFVEQLVDEGVFDVSDNFRPADKLNRAELVKIVITAMDGLADYQAPATPTFDDVSVDAWFYEYVEAAVQLGVVSGYTDASGNLTGMFGPGDTVNRAAATKILVNGFAVPTTLNPGSGFPDVGEPDWFHDYVVTAYNMSILDGYSDGRFGPADPVTRAQVAKLTVNAQDPIIRSQVIGDVTDPADIILGSGALELSLNDNTPPSTTIPMSATSVDLLSMDFTAADDDVTLANLVVTRGGVGQTTDWEGLYIYDGSTRLTTARSINSDTNTATFSLNVLVSAGTTKALRLVGDSSSSPLPSNQHYFYVASAADVTSNAQSVAGDFPVAGNTFTMGSVAVTSLAISAGSEPSQPVVGASNVEIAAFKLAAGAENDVALHQITLTQNGSLSSSKIVNLRLLRGTDEVGYATGFDGDLVAFVLETPFVIDKGQTKNFYVRADIDGGRPNDDSIQLYLDESTDLVGIDQQYGYGTTVTNNYTTAFSLPITLKGGKVTVADNGPAAHQVAQNTTNVALLDFSITADRDIDVKDMDLQLMAGIGGNFSDVPVPTLVPVTSAIAAGTTATPAVPATFATGALQDVAISAATAGLAGSSQTVTVTMIAAATLACNVTAGGAALAIECEAGATTATLAAAIASDGLFTTTGGSVALATAGTVTLTGGADLIPEVLAGATPNLRTGFMTTTAHAGDVADVFSVTISGTTYYCALATAAPDTSVANVTTDCPAVTPAGGEIITWGLDPYQWIENVRIVDIDTGATLQGPVTRFNATTVSTGPLNTTYSKKMSEDYSLVAGDTRHLRVEADFNQNMPSGLEVQAYINFKPALSAYLKDVDANKAVPTGDIVGGEMTGKKMTIKQNSLTVAKTTNVLTRQHVKGSQGVNALQIALQAGDAGDITVKKLIMRVYADDDGTFNNLGGAATGDVEAKNYISSVSLYDGDTLVAGPVALELVGGLVGATYLPETATSYDKALFENFSLVIPKGQTKNLTVKFNLLNNTGALTYYLAVDMDPAADITAEDVDSNTVTASSGHLNLLASPTPQIVMIGSGSLSASVTGSYSPEVYVGGTNDLLVAQYKFTAEKEAYTVNTLTVLNDADGILNTAEETNVIENVVLVYTDINGSEQTRSGSLTAGLSVKFSDLGFYIPEEGGATLKIYADTKAIDTQFFSLSGKKFKLALKELNTGSSEFEAIGVSSSEANYFLAPTDITGAANLATNVLRRAKPIFTHLPNTNVLSTTNNFYQFSVTANGGDVTLGRLVFDVATSGTVTGVANLRIQSSDTSLQSVGDVSGSTVTIVGAQAIVAFDQQQTIPSGDTFYYVLKGDIVGGLADNDSVEVRFASGDEAVEVTNFLAGPGYDNDNDLVLLTANTTYLSGAAAGQGLFVTGGYLGTVGTALNVVWSDHSGGNSCSSLDPVADPGCTVLGTAVSKGHVYPEIVAGAVTPDSGTADWTNGYLLNIEQLDPTNLTK